MIPATTLVLPTLRECPPTTTSAMTLFSQVSSVYCSAIFRPVRFLSLPMVVILGPRLEPIPYPGIGNYVLRIFAWLNFVAQLVIKRKDIPTAAHFSPRSSTRSEDFFRGKLIGCDAPGRPRLPSPVRPKPLLRVPRNKGFDHFREECGIRQNVEPSCRQFAPVATPAQNISPVFAKLFVPPNSRKRDNCRIGV